MSLQRRYLEVALLLVAIVATLCFMQRTPLLVDEWVHYKQIVTFAASDYALDPRLATGPGYHLAMAQLVRILHSDSTTLLRGANALLGVASIFVFARCRQLVANSGDQRVAQFAVFPIIFPYFFLIYTDIASLLVVLCGLLLCLKQRYALACAVLILSVGIRQSNVVWLLAIPALAWLQQTDFDLSWRNLRAFARRCWLLGVGLAGFAVFVALNQGVALGDRSAHPPFRFSVGNLFFFLFVYALLLLPHVLSRAAGNLRSVLAPRHAILLWAGFCVLYLLVFDISHPYNYVGDDYFLHNVVLTAVASSIWLKAAFLVPILLAALDLTRSMRERKAVAVIVVASAIVLLPAWLIEQRYYMVSFALLLLFCPEGDPRSERLTTLLCAVLSAAFLYGIQQGVFFL